MRQQRGTAAAFLAAAALFGYELAFPMVGVDDEYVGWGLITVATLLLAVAAFVALQRPSSSEQSNRASLWVPLPKSRKEAKSEPLFWSLYPYWLATVMVVSSILGLVITDWFLLVPAATVILIVSIPIWTDILAPLWYRLMR